MASRRENHRYDESGLPNVVLVDVDVRRCPTCGTVAVAIPHVEELHRVLAMMIIRQVERLTPHQIRYLRKWLGWSGADFARHMGVTPSTVSRWENTQEPTPMGATADRLLRSLVAMGRPVESYPSPEQYSATISALMETLPQIKDEPSELPLLGMKASRSGWEPTELAA